MAAFNKFNSFVEAICEKVHNLGSDQLVVALGDVASVVAELEGGFSATLKVE